MSLRAKLLIATGVLVAVGLGITGFVTVAATRAQMVGRVDEMLRGAALRPPPAPAPRQVAPGGGGGSPAQPAGGQGSTDSSTGGRGTGAASGGPQRNALALLVFDPSGVLIDALPSGFEGDPDPLPDVRPGDPEKPLPIGRPFTAGAVDGASFSYRALMVELPDRRTLVVAAPLDEIDANVERLAVIWALTSLAVLAMLILTGWFLISRDLAPVYGMAETASEIAAGDLSRRVEHDDPSTEIGQLGAALNTMLAQIQTAFEARQASETRLRQFVSDASHELRTPITAIRGYAELHRSGAAETPEQVARAMRRIEAESIRMGNLVESLLLLARLDQERPGARERVDLSVIAEDAVADARAVEPERPISFEGSQGAVVIADEDRLRQVVANLLANARVHTPPETAVHVSVGRSESGSLRLEITDEGPGLDREAAARVFDRFWRAEESRSRNSGGTGLGLSIVKSIVESYGGSVSVEAAPGQGAAFTVELPPASS